MADWNVLISVAGVGVSALGLLITLAVSRSKRLLYAYRVVTLDAVKHPDLGLTFKGNAIPNVYSVRFVFWNSGRNELRKEDIPLPKAGPALRLSENMEVLSLEVVSTTGDWSARLDEATPNHLFLAFDYLNRGDAVLGEVLCTSKDGKDPKVLFTGAIKGAKVAQGRTENLHWRDHIVFVFAEVFMVFLAFSSAKFAYDEFVAGEYYKLTKVVLFLLILFLLAYANLYLNILSIPRTLSLKYERFLTHGALQAGDPSS